MNNRKFIALGKTELKEELFTRNLENNYINKPVGALWSSPYTPGEKYISDWHRFVMEENFYSERYYVGVAFKVKYSAKILEIDSEKDLRYVAEHYNLENSLTYTTLLDFEKIAEDFDAIYLTENGQEETRFSAYVNLYGWDVETLLILNFDCIDTDSFEYVRIEG